MALIQSLLYRFQTTNFFPAFLSSFYLLLFLNLNNKTLLLILLGASLALYLKFKDLKLAFWLVYLLVLPFEKGKGIAFTLVPYYLISQGIPYNYWFTITFADIFFLLVIYLLVREEILAKWQVKKNKLKRQDLFALVFLGFGLATVFLSQFPAVSFLGFIRLARMAAAYFLARWAFQEIGRVKPTLLVLASSVLFQGTWAATQFAKQGLLGRDLEQIGEFFSVFGHITVEPPFFFRSSGTFVHPNSLAAFLVILLPVVFGQVLSRSFSTKERRFFLVSLVLGGLGLLFTASRAAWGVAFVVGILNLVFLRRKKKLKWVFLGKKQAMQLGAILGLFLPLLIIPRFTSLMSAFEKYASAYYRMELIHKALWLTQKYPFGSGLETFPALLVYELGEFFTTPAPVHNLFLQISVALGILGLVAFLILVLLAFKAFFKGKQTNRHFWLKTAAFFGCLSFLLLGNFYPLFLVPNVSEYFWILLSVLGI